MGNVSLEVTEIPGPLSAEIKRIERYEVLVEKAFLARTKTKIIPVVTLPIPTVYWTESSKDWKGEIKIIEATGIPKNQVLGGEDCATGRLGRELRESVQIAKTISPKFVKMIDPRNQFFENNW